MELLHELAAGTKMACHQFTLVASRRRYSPKDFLRATYTLTRVLNLNVALRPLTVVQAATETDEGSRLTSR
jgi:hypothetical protein